MSILQMNAADLLDKACKFENEGKPALAIKAFDIAMKRDVSEHAANPNTASLPRS